MSKKQKYEMKKHNNTKIWMIIVSVVVLAFLILLGVRLFGSESEAIKIGKKPKDFVLTSFSGEMIDTQELRGKVVLIHFWASWCTTCEDEALLLESAWKFYQRNHPDEVTFIGVTYKDTDAASMYFMETHGLTFPNGPDPEDEISTIYQVGGVPETYILDASGKLTSLKYGAFPSMDEITAAIEAVLAE